MDIELFRHQRQLGALPWVEPTINHFNVVAGFSAGKSFSLVNLWRKLAQKYWNQPVKIGLGSTTISMLKKTVVSDFVKLMEMSGSDYTYNKSENVLRIGKMEFVLIATDQPDQIYAYNFSGFLWDEADELEQTKCLAANTAIQERTRVPFPDGRSPFSVIATTAHGYRGMYAIEENLKETKTAFAHIRASTSENTKISHDYYRKLYDLYTPNERMAYLEGYYVNLTAGRVYPEYDDSIHFGDDIQVEPWETIYVGQDLNEGYSKGVAIVIRDRAAFCVAEFSFEAIGRAPKVLREKFSHNRILVYPDNSGKPILGGYAEEFAEQNIELAWTGRNPSIVDRIFIVNKLLLIRRMVVCKSCKNLSLALKTRQFDKSGKPEKGQGSTSPDHICDALEYGIFRIVADQEEFADLYSLTPTARRGE